MSHQCAIFVSMGSQGIFEYDYTADVRTAFRKLQDRDATESGSGAYAGNMTGMAGFTVMSVPPLTVWEAYEMFLRREDNLRKWEPGEAVPLLPPSATEKPKKRTVKLNLFSAEKEAERTGKNFGVYETIRAMAKEKMKDGEHIAEFRIVERNRECSHKVVRSQGKASRQFVVDGKAFPTFEEASQHALNVADRFGVLDDRQLRIVEEVVRGGEPKAKVVSRVTKHTAVVEIAYVKVPTDNDVVGGWAFYGYVPC